MAGPSRIGRSAARDSLVSAVWIAPARRALTGGGRTGRTVFRSAASPYTDRLTPGLPDPGRRESDN